MPILRRTWIALVFVACMGAQAQLPHAAAKSPSATPLAAPPAAPSGPISAAQPQLVLSADGTLVIDTRARLAWVRCSEGMLWTGRTCAGVPRMLTHVQALALATQRWKAEGLKWRLPRVPEMRRLVDKSTNPPGLNPVLFPGAPGDWHWSATAHVNAFNVNPYAYGTVERGGQGEGSVSLVQGWAVNMGTGEASKDFGRGTPLMVRLVRPATERELPLPPPKNTQEDDGDAQDDEE